MFFAFERELPHTPPTFPSSPGLVLPSGCLPVFLVEPTGAARILALLGDCSAHTIKAQVIFIIALDEV